MPGNFYEVLWIFSIYAFIGWCVEVAFAAVSDGVFVNRGFLNGPYCPIYGIGVLIVVAVLTPLKGNPLILFAGSVLLTTILEYMTGFVLEKVFKNKWWDYSEMPFNIRGYVCLKFSIMWGLGCMFIMNQIHPYIYRFIQWIPKKAGTILLVMLVAAFVGDAIVTVNTILKFNKKMRVLEEIASGMHRLSEEIGEDIFERVTDITEKAEDAQEYLQDKKTEIEGLKFEYKKVLEQRHLGFRRLMKAFPNLKSIEHDKILQQYKEFWKIRK